MIAVAPERCKAGGRAHALRADRTRRQNGWAVDDPEWRHCQLPVFAQRLGGIPVPVRGPEKSGAQSRACRRWRLVAVNIAAREW